MRSKQFSRRQLLLRGCATFSTALLLKACKQAPTSTQEVTNAGSGYKFMPLQSISVPPKNNQTPTGLIVCLHGFGASAQDLAPYASLLNLPNYKFLFPNAPYPHPRFPEGRMWYNLETQDNQGLTKSRGQLIDWLKSLASETGVPLSRTILSGFSQGGAMTLDVGLTLPFAGLVSLSGYMHSKPQLISSQSLPPVLIVHGRQDKKVSLSEAQRARDNLKALGGSVKYQEFNMGHEIKPEVLALMRSFILDIIK